jgi:hypothetical protein
MLAAQLLSSAVRLEVSPSSLQLQRSSTIDRQAGPGVIKVSGSVPTRSFRSILIFVVIGLAIEFAIAMGSRWFGYSAGFSFLAAALFTPALICFIFLPRQKSSSVDRD